MRAHMWIHGRVYSGVVDDSKGLFFARGLSLIERYFFFFFAGNNVRGGAEGQDRHDGASQRF